MNRVVVASLAALGVGAAALPVTSVGIGWPISVLAIGGVVWAARSSRPADHADVGDGNPDADRARRAAAERVDRGWRAAAGAAALVLSAVPAVRASGVLALLCLAAATMLGSYALAGGRDWRGIASGAVAVFPGAARGLAWAVAWRPGSGGRVGRVIAGTVVGIALIALLTPLLTSADPVFADLLTSWAAHLSRVDGGRIVAGTVLVGLAVAGAGYLAYNKRRSSLPSTVDCRQQLTVPEWAIPLMLVNALFGVFVVVQLHVLFGGHDYVLGAGGPDYAEYARGGSGQLGVVTALALGLAGGLGLWARRDTFKERYAIRVLGGLLCGLTLVIVASALKRLLLYVDAYGFTWTRLLGFSGEAWLGLVVFLLMVAGVGLRGDWLPRATAAAAVGVLFALVAVNPEAVMARTLLTRYDGPYAVDFAYLSGLSADAVDEIARLPPRDQACALQDVRRALDESDPWYAVNLARYRARITLATIRVGRDDCGGVV